MGDFAMLLCSRPGLIALCLATWLALAGCGPAAPPAVDTAAPVQSAAVALVSPAPVATGPVRHVVVLVQENHTFDNYFGSFPGADGQTTAQLPECTDWRTANGAHCQWPERDLPYYWALARAYGLGDRYFTEVEGPSYPNHLFLIAADAPILDDPPGSWSCPDRCFAIPNIADSLNDLKLNWIIYAGADNVTSIFSIRSIYDQRKDHVRGPESIYTDAAAGQLPAVAWVMPEFVDSEHPGNDIRVGETWVHSIVDAILASPEASSTVILITWDDDDDGGVFDHVKPPVIEQLTATDGKTAHRLGGRVPLLVVSPLAKRGYVSHQQASHLSIVRFIERTFGLMPLNTRDAAATDLSDYFPARQ
jgi:phospholipase C